MVSIDTNAPREGPEPSNAENIRIQKSTTGSVHTAIGESHFYTKYGIKPITDSIESGEHVAELESPIKMKNVRKLHEGSTKFPKLEECAHFHYDHVELKTIKASLSTENQENIHSGMPMTSADYHFYIQIVSNDNKTWIVRRSFDNFRAFDKQLHRCIFDRKYSLLPEVRKNDFNQENIQEVREALLRYLHRFSSIAGNMINCGPVLSWLEMDNRGNRLLVTDDSSAINTPAVSAGHVIKRYQSQAPDELSLQVGDIISIIDMPRTDETMWWRGKKGFEVGFFPCECIEVIGDKIPQAIESKIPETPPKPVLRKRGKLITFLRAFFTSRPARTQLKRTGIVKERVFGCDLGEHLLNSKQDVPLILKNCAEVIEEHGIVDGIYRLSGVASNIQKLRNDFDEEKVPNLRDDVYLQDIHSISSLLKAYFRELPNPLLTYQLYDKFSAAVQNDDNKLVKIHDVIQQLPPPHYRTAEFLFRHLNQVAKYGAKTGMHCKNIAIVWAPNLMRSKELDRDTERACSTAMLQGVGVQAIVTEFLIQYTDLIFSDKLQSFSDDKDASGVRRSRPKSLAISTPTKLLSLEEAREQILAGQSNNSPKQKYIEVGGGPANLPTDYHTVIELPNKKKSRKSRKSPSASSAQQSSSAGGNVGSSSSWRNIFTRGSKNLKKQDSTSEDTLLGAQSAEERQSKLRAVHSAESLASAASSTHSRLSDFNDDVFPQPGDDLKLKSSTYDRPKSKKAKKSSRRSLSADLSQSESDLSEMDEGMGVRMETDTHVVEEKVSKKSKLKEAKRSKKKSHARSSSDGPLVTELFASHQNPSPRSKSDSRRTADTLEPQDTGEAAPNQSPSIKERLVHALTPTSPRKKIKGPAPSPPRSPSATLDIPPPAKTKKKSKKNKGATASQPEAQEDQPVVAEQVDTVAQSSATVQLSPIEEAQNSDMSITPDAEQRIAASPGTSKNKSRGAANLDLLPPQDQTTLVVGGSEFYDTLQSERSDMTEVTLTNTEMSMSLDSLLKEVTGSDSHYSASDGNSNFSTFGKKSGDAGAVVAPIPKPRVSKRVVDNKDAVDGVSVGETERNRTPSTNSVLETDMDSFELQSHPSMEELSRESTQIRSPHRVSRKSADARESDDEERFNYVAPLPGDVKMMSNYPDLIAPNLMSQIVLEDSDVQYVDPYQADEPEEVSDNTGFAEYSAESRHQFVNAQDEATSALTEHDLVIDLPKTNWQTTEPMVTSSMMSSEQAVPDVIGTNGDDKTKVIDWPEVSEPARIVIHKRNETASEVDTFVSTKCRVVPPPKQFAYMGPPVVSGTVDEEGVETNLDDVESPIDDFPSPPPPEAFLEDSKPTDYVTNNLADGYIADRSSSASPITMDKDHFQEQLKAISQPVVIEEQDISMATSPGLNSEVAMVTSSVESDHLILDNNHKVHVEDTKRDTRAESQQRDVPESHEMVFQMDDIKMKSNDSLHNISMLSDERSSSDKVETVEKSETKDTTKQGDFFFYMDNTKHEPVESQSKSNCEFETNVVTAIPSSVATEESASKKSTPVKRKKSVKELLSKFEMTNSPPSDSGVREVKVKPAVFQKPKVVRMHSLTKSNEFESVDESPKPEVADHISIMSASCPDATRILSLSPRSIDMDIDVTPDRERANSKDLSSPEIEENSLTQLAKRPSVKNKIQHFESTASSESFLSENETPKLRPERSPQRSERSPTRAIPERSKSPQPVVSPRPVSPTKEVIIQERKVSKPVVPEPVTSSGSNKTIFPAAKTSQQSPQLSRKARNNTTSSEQRSNARSSFKMRSASSTGTTTLVSVQPEQEPNTQQSMSERLRRFEDSNVSDSGVSPKVKPKPKSETVDSSSQSGGKSNVRPTSDNSTLEKKRPDVPVKDYKRSVSVPQSNETQNKRSASTSQTQSTANIVSEVEEESNGVLKPSQLFSRRSKRLSEPPPVAQKTVIVKDKSDDDVMVSSFSDRRKLFESSTDSVVSSNYGSLKRSEIYMKPKQQNIEIPAKSTPAVVHKEIELSHNKTGQSDSAKQRVTIENQNVNNETNGKFKQFGAKGETKHSEITQDKSAVKSRTEQKENLKPSVTLKSSEKDIEKERSGSVKDLWRKFEHNTQM